MLASLREVTYFVILSEAKDLCTSPLKLQDSAGSSSSFSP